MQTHNQHMEISIVKNSENEGPIPSAWRPMLTNIADAFARHDYHLVDGIPGVALVSEATAAQVRRYIEGYGATLIALPKESWNTSVCIWMGVYWDALIDLWTEEEGPSDLVLQVHITEADSKYAVAVHMVYVP